MTIHFDQRISLSALAKEALDQCNGDYEVAIEKLRRLLRRDRALLNQVVRQAVMAQVPTEMRRIRHRERDAIIAQARDAVAEAAEHRARTMRGAVKSAVATFKAHTTRWVEFPIPPRAVLLGEATYYDLTEAIEFFEKNYRPSQVNAEWLKLIRARLREDCTQRVGDALAEADLTALRAEVVMEFVPMGERDALMIPA